ncbi:MAG TPA: hypothetical protein VEO00_12090, partial [Actinomycetota bacterium]|nr:hypothetical protein [Actinomycetota bacterium]
MSKRAAAALLAFTPAVVLIAAPTRPASAAPALPPLSHVAVVVMDRVTIDQVAAMPAVRDAPDGWTAGLVSTAGRGVVGPTAGALTFSAGARAIPPAGEDVPFTLAPGPVDERLPTVGTVGDAYTARTGEREPAATDPEMPPFVYPDIDLVAQLNARPEVRARPGLLGSEFADRNIDRAVVTIREAPVRLAPLVAM